MLLPLMLALGCVIATVKLLYSLAPFWDVHFLVPIAIPVLHVVLCSVFWQWGRCATNQISAVVCRPCFTSLYHEKCCTSVDRAT